MNVQKFKEAFSETILELILTAVLFGIGILILSILNIKSNDFETPVLIGIIACALVTALIVLCIKLASFAKRQKGEKNAKKE